MDGTFDFYSIYAGQPMGKIPRLLGRKVMERIVGEMLNLEDYFCADDVQSRVIRQRRLSSPVPFRANASYCDVCFRAFKLLSHKLQCYFCHHVLLTASSLSTYWLR
ncbi:hypothetical protein SPRG_17416 [Saprolegnia parasitica CBS 223.65]|uniref:FYVE zinc finger domain-containing protein n=1 Tax=Saprolegnia parasitica (strain CBS 223.65) TaxID=695850 RepID=A0A067BSE7_SAPPC|nr:hypothetical protein SPRG_17416 [Saprolegnia parasitica CBS 223.65]KDO17186.1 hypothetical protein SPRG_17416 [Saprolegnia parasitica CBS 223.65]|eukprot:XP_012212106.1 hypothetical protein SPRG_17416 [Saprolegnia parasitica CBS 223.65]